MKRFPRSGSILAIFSILILLFIPLAHCANSKPFEFPDQLKWLNADHPVKVADLKGKFVLVHFWGYAGLSIQFMMDQIHELQRKYPNELVVIGVHSAKELDSVEMLKNITTALERYDIHYPVAVDDELMVLKAFHMDGWPSIVFLNPDGKPALRRAGEKDLFYFVDRIIQKNISKFEPMLNRKPIHFYSSSLESLGSTEQASMNKPSTLPDKILQERLIGTLSVDDIGKIATQDGSSGSVPIGTVLPEDVVAGETSEISDRKAKAFTFNSDHFIGERVVLNRTYSRKIGSIRLNVRLPNGTHLLTAAKSYARIFTKKEGLLATVDLTDLNSNISLHEELNGDHLNIELMLYYCRQGKDAICVLKGIWFDVPLEDYPQFEDITITHTLTGG